MIRGNSVDLGPETGQPETDEMDNLKICPMCGREFSADDILHDSDITPLGMRIEKDDSRLNYFYFTHDVAECGTTFVIPVEAFESCLPAPPPAQILTGTDDCRGLCLDLAEHGFCDQDCRWAPYRRLLQQMLTERDKRATPETESFKA